MSSRGYDEMSASEVIGDLHGPGYRNDEGEVWDGEEFRSPGEVADDGGAVAAAKKDARKEYLKPFKSAVRLAERRVEEAKEVLRDAQNDLERAKVNADRWYRL